MFVKGLLINAPCIWHVL